MFTIYADGELLYAPNLTDQGYSILNPKLTEELNKAGSLTFTLPTDNVMYDRLQKLKSIVVVYLDGEEIWRGRVLHDEKDFYNRKAVYCEGMLSFLLDSVLRPYDFTGPPSTLFGEYIRWHNAQVDERKQFKIGQCTVEDGNDYVHYSSSQYPNTLNEMLEKLVGNLGGYLRTRVTDNGEYVLDYLADYGTISDQVIEFGSNLQDLSEYISAENVFTVLIPLGKQEETKDGTQGERLTIESVNDGKDYIEAKEAIKLFGRIERTQVWDDVTIAGNLYAKGEAYLAAGTHMAVTLSIKALDLHFVNNDTKRICLGDSVRVVSVPHGLDTHFVCSKIVTDLQSPEKTEFTLGAGFAAMTDQQAALKKQSQKAYSIAETATSTISNVSVNVTDNYVPKSQFMDFQSQVNENFEAVSNRLSSVYHVKGSVENEMSLPEIHAVGDVYNVLDTGANYVWTEGGWDKLSETVDLTSIAAAITDLEARVSALEEGGE